MEDIRELMKVQDTWFRTWRSNPNKEEYKDYYQNIGNAVNRVMRNRK